MSGIPIGFNPSLQMQKLINSFANTKEINFHDLQSAVFKILDVFKDLEKLPSNIDIVDQKTLDTLKAISHYQKIKNLTDQMQTLKQTGQASKYAEITSI